MPLHVSSTMCLKHETYYNTRFCALSWLFTKRYLCYFFVLESDDETLMYLIYLE